jgi:hypothetical protein
LSLSLALGILKRQSMVARVAFRSDSQALASFVTISLLPNLWAKHCSVRTAISTEGQDGNVVIGQDAKFDVPKSGDQVARF